VTRTSVALIAIARKFADASFTDATNAGASAASRRVVLTLDDHELLGAGGEQARPLRPLRGRLAEGGQLIPECAKRRTRVAWAGEESPDVGEHRRVRMERVEVGKRERGPCVERMRGQSPQSQHANEGSVPFFARCEWGDRPLSLT
jgi:hypothetical protein